MHTLPDTLSTSSDFLHYFENIAEKNKLIRHEPENPKRQRFFTDWDNIKGTEVKGTILVVSPLPISYIDEDGDNIHQVPQFEITVLKAVGTDGQKAINEAVDECKKANKQILAKLYYDSRPQYGAPRYFTRFRIEEVTTSILDAPKLNDGWVGVSSSVPMGSPESFAYDENDWDN